MSETNRATFSTISTQKDDVKKVKERPKTIRFKITLPESNEKSCPEYNYRDLLNSAEKKNKLKEKSQGEVNGLNHLDRADPFDDNDDDVKRIAKQFEEKYGLPKTTKRKGKKDDYADIGAGYDESDSFIDNTDAYDEMVPEDVTTVHGGFYINSGALEFKQVELSRSESSESEASDIEKPTSRKRIIEDSDESDSEEEKDETKIEKQAKKPKIEVNEVQKPAKKKLILTDEKENVVKENIKKVVKKKVIEENVLKKKSITVKDLLREKREEIDMTIPPDSPQKETKPSGSSTINDVIESVVNAGRVENIDENSKESSSSSYDPAIVSAASSESESSRDGLPTPLEHPQVETQKVEAEMPIVKLPEKVPENVLKIVNDIKKAAENSEGKVKFFSGPVNNMLLSLEINARSLLRSDRVQIFEHLAPFLKCKKDTLMRRAKNLLLDQERSKLKDPLMRLKLTVDNIMPVVKKNYEKECQKVRDEMFLASATSANSDSDVNSKLKKFKTPKKKFPWSDETRKIFQEIIMMQKKYFTLIRTRKETFEGNLEIFLKATVLPIWPEGFMTINTLMQQAKIILETESRKTTPTVMTPISLDIHASAAPSSPFAHSPVKNISPSCSTGVSGITVIPIPQSSLPSPKAAALNDPKIKSEVSVNKKVELPSALTTEVMSTKEIKECSEKVSGSLLIPSSKSSVTITSVDLSTNNNTKKEVNEDEISAPAPKPTNLKQRILNDINKPRVENNDDCQIIDLTDAPVVIRKPGPKSKTRYADAGAKPKRLKEERVERPELGSIRPTKLEDHKKVDASQALNQFLTKYSTDLNNKRIKEDLSGIRPGKQEDLIQKEESPARNQLLSKYSTDLSTKPNYKETSKRIKEPSELSGIRPVKQEDLIQKEESAARNQLLSKYSTDLSTKPNYKETSKRIKEPSELSGIRPVKQEDLIQKEESQARNQLLSKYSTDLSTKPSYKEPSKRIKEPSELSGIRPTKQEDLIQIEESQALNQFITKYSTDLSTNPAAGVNEDDMEQVMKDLKELQQLQEHARKNDLDVMAPSSSPVSVIAFNSNYSPKQANDLSTKERKVDNAGFQDIFQKHLFQETSLLKPSQSSSVYNSNVQPKNSNNSLNNFSYTSAGSISNTMNNIRYSQSSSKYTSPVNHLPTNPSGATNHNDDFTLFQNFLYQYGFHNTSGPKQKSPP